MFDNEETIRTKAAELTPAERNTMRDAVQTGYNAVNGVPVHTWTEGQAITFLIHSTIKMVEIQRAKDDEDDE